MFALVTCLLINFGFSQGQLCHFESMPTIKIDANVHTYKYVEKDRPELYLLAKPSGQLLKYQAKVSKKTKTDQDFLLDRQMKIFLKSGSADAKLAHFFEQVKTGAIGEITPINCLESLLYDLHLGLQKKSPFSEFSAVIYQKQIHGQPYLEIFFASTHEANAPNQAAMLTKKNKPIWAFLHNHFFYLSPKSEDVAGTLVPSGFGPPGNFSNPLADLGYFRTVAQKFGLKQAWITNGFHSSHFKIEDKNHDGNFWVY